jgi:hypothetical protein
MPKVIAVGVKDQRRTLFEARCMVSKTNTSSEKTMNFLRTLKFKPEMISDGRSTNMYTKRAKRTVNGTDKCARKILGDIRARKNY